MSKKNTNLTQIKYLGKSKQKHKLESTKAFNNHKLLLTCS